MRRGKLGHRRRWGLLLLSHLLGVSSALAQSSPFFPPSVAITNYDRVLVGEEEALESGAFVARVRSTTSGWYNPAGMILVDKTVIAASGNGYEADAISLEGLKSGKSGGFSLSQLPSFLGAVFGEDVMHSKSWRLGFSITKPIAWSQGIQGGGGTGGRVSYSSDVSFSTILPMLSAAYAPLPCLRFGLGVGVALTSLSEVQTLSAQVLTSTSANAFLRTVDAGGSVWNLTGNVGFQFDITKNLVVGATLRLPGVKILSSGGMTFQDVENLNGSPWNQVFFKDLNAAFDFKLPTEIDFGLGWQSRAFGLELDIRYHSAISDYFLLSSSNTVQRVTSAPDGSPVVTNTPFPGIQNGAHDVWNWAIGGNVTLTEEWSLHAGFFTDRSPTSAAGASMFRAINMYGFTVGARIHGDHLSGSFGIGYNWGTSETFNFPDITSGNVITTKLAVKTFQVLYAIAYTF